jgi:hypothetical protein
MKPARLFSVLSLFVLTLACNNHQSVKQESPKDQEPYRDFSYGSEPVTPGASIEQVALPQRTARNYASTFAGLFRRLDKPAQEFRVRADCDTVIHAEQGTVIHIKANSLVYAGTHTPVTGPVWYNVKEYYTTADILMADLTTTAKDRLLETGGMIHIEAWSDGKPCALAEGNAIDVGFPYDQFKPGMQTFNGTWNNGSVEWTPRTVVASQVTGLEGAGSGSPKPLMLVEGSDEDLWPYISNPVRYPYSSLIGGEKGTVYVSFECDEELRVHSVQVEVGASPALDKAAQFIVAGIPKWEPAAEVDAKFVRFLVPIKFVPPLELTYSDYQKAKQFERRIARIETNYSNRFDNRSATKVLDMKRLVDSYNANASSRFLGSYLVQSGQLGWINCDRYINEPRRTEFIAQIPPSLNADIKMVFHDVKSFINGDMYSDGVVFKNVPVDKDVTIVAMRYDGTTPYLATYKTNTSSQDGIQLNFEKLTVEALAEKLKELNEV